MTATAAKAGGEHHKEQLPYVDARKPRHAGVRLARHPGRLGRRLVALPRESGTQALRLRGHRPARKFNEARDWVHRRPRQLVHRRGHSAHRRRVELHRRCSSSGCSSIADSRGRCPRSAGSASWRSRSGSPSLSRLRSRSWSRLSCCPSASSGFGRTHRHADRHVPLGRALRSPSACRSAIWMARSEAASSGVTPCSTSCRRCRRSCYLRRSRCSSASARSAAVIYPHLCASAGRPHHRARDPGVSRPRSRRPIAGPDPVPAARKVQLPMAKRDHHCRRQPDDDGGAVDGDDRRLVNGPGLGKPVLAGLQV